MVNRQKGFSPVEVILVLVVIALLGVGGWYIWQVNNGKTATSDSNAIVSSSVKYEGWKTYNDSVGKFSIKYPGDWSVTTQKGDQGVGYPTTSTKIISPSGRQMELEVNYGGKGGACAPDPSDKPFQVNNTCPTVEYLSAEKLKDVYIYDLETAASGETKTAKFNLFLVTTHYQNNSQSSYGISLRSSTSSSIPIKEPATGAVDLRLWFSKTDSEGKNPVYIEANAVSDTEALLNDSDAETIKDILRSFTLNS